MRLLTTNSLLLRSREGCCLSENKTTMFFNRSNCRRRRTLSNVKDKIIQSWYGKMKREPFGGGKKAQGNGSCRATASDHLARRDHGELFHPVMLVLRDGSVTVLSTIQAIWLMSKMLPQHALKIVIVVFAGERIGRIL